MHLFSNKITNIKIGNFIHLVKLEELMINKNEINSFEKTTFTGLGNMKRLDFSGNKITTRDNIISSQCNVDICVNKNSIDEKVQYFSI